MSDIGPGDRVECIRTGFGMGIRVVQQPQIGQIYTIRGICNDGGFWLEEIINPPQQWSNGFMECSYDKEGFRPIRSTDISIFTDIDEEISRGVKREIPDEVMV